MKGISIGGDLGPQNYKGTPPQILILNLIMLPEKLSIAEKVRNIKNLIEIAFWNWPTGYKDVIVKSKPSLFWD